MCLAVGELSVVQLNSEAARSHGESVTFVQPATQTGVYRSQSAVLVPSRTSTSCFYSCMRVLYPTRDPARVGIQSTFLDPDSEFYPCRSLRLRIPKALDPDSDWIPTRESGISSTRNQLQQAAAGSQTRCAALNVQRPASRATPSPRRRPATVQPWGPS